MTAAGVMTSSSLSTDPLLVLGSSLLFNICEHLPYRALTRLPSVCKSWRDFATSNQSGIWRSASRRFGLSSQRIEKLREQERDAHLAQSSDQEAAVEQAGLVDWREVCKELVMPDINFTNGSFENQFLKTGNHSTVQSFVVDEEDQTCITICQRGGIEVLDLHTSEFLFHMKWVCPGGILEVCKGYVLLRRHSDDFCFHIFRTRSAIARSKYPYSPEENIVAETRTAELFADPDWEPKSTLRPAHYDPDGVNQQRPPPIGRGCLSFYRNIIMESESGVCRMRTLNEGTEEERVVLAIATKRGIYLHDLDNPDQAPEVFEYPKGVSRLVCLDFNDDFILLCGPSQIHIISRSTRECVLSFPPTERPGRLLCAVAYSVNDRHYTPESADEDQDDWGRDTPQLSRKLVAEGFRRENVIWENMMFELWVRWKRGEETACRSATGFLACHFSHTDLICAHDKGHLIIVRDFAAVLSIPEPDIRAQRLEEHTIILDLGTCIRHLSVHGTHVAIDTGTRPSKRTVFFDTNALPSLPLSPLAPSSGAEVDEYDWSTYADAPSFTIRMVLPVDPCMEEMLGEVQVYSTGMYSTYRAFGSAPEQLNVSQRVRRLNFGSDVGLRGETGADEDWNSESSTLEHW